LICHYNELSDCQFTSELIQRDDRMSVDDVERWVDGQVWYRGWEVPPGCLIWVLPKRSIPKPDQHRKDIIHQESLGTDMP